MRPIASLLVPLLATLVARAAPSPDTAPECYSELDCAAPPPVIERRDPPASSAPPSAPSAPPTPSSPPSSPPTQVPSYKTWLPAQGGCWQDHNTDRALDHYLGSDPARTVQQCLDACQSQGFFLAAVEYGHECSCGNTIFDNNRPTSASNCNMPCSGDATQQCGGAGAMNLYVRDNYPFTVGPASVLPSYNGYAVTQCWQDNTSNRILKQRPAGNLNQDQMTVQKCIDGCAAAGFSSAGLEFGRECYCDNVSYPIGQSTDMSECNMPCLGDASEFCGARDRMLVYYKPQFTTYRGIIQVINKDNNAVIGYIAKTSLNGALYRFLASESDAVHVTFQLPTGQSSGTGLELTTQDSDQVAFPFMGLVQGRDNNNSNLGNNFQYAYISNTNTNPNGTPAVVGNQYNTFNGASRTSESKVWSINVATGDVQIVWTNTDGSKPAITYFTQSTALYVGGNVAAFGARYPAPIINLKYKFLLRP